MLPDRINVAIWLANRMDQVRAPFSCEGEAFSRPLSEAEQLAYDVALETIRLYVAGDITCAPAEEPEPGPQAQTWRANAVRMPGGFLVCANLPDCVDRA